MRVTVCLCRQHYGRRWKEIWKREGKLKIPSTDVPRWIQDLGIQVVDPTVPPPVEKKRWTLPVPDDPRFCKPTYPNDHPDFHEQKRHIFNLNTYLLEGTKQIKTLTKTQVIEGQPKPLADLIGKVDHPLQDELIQRYIMQANVWNPATYKLPKRINFRLPGWKYKPETGITMGLMMRTLVENLIRLCDMIAVEEYPQVLTERRHTHDHVTWTHFNTQGVPIHVLAHSDHMISSNKPLPLFADEAMIDSSKAIVLPDFYPMSPLIDVKLHNVWREDTCNGWTPEYQFPHVHNFVFLNNDTWPNDRRNARAIMFCLAHCLTQAKKLYGEDVKVLPKPISVNCTHTNGIVFHFVNFQLNTLDFENQEGVKNIAWIDSCRMYRKILPKRAMLNKTEYKDYNPVAFQMFKARYLHGLVK
ncbi:39S ribosomal protein L37, mitochondrial [Lingula anatina]|uniref:39S ribosomal protein L37, mitochondrial n=1 Tax=Lingula anatina TaxID=7574 RepID=A0A1S3HT70_LINAN|nr:39S ribosomal protein L37, mitochondrial [Lingula anatina]XP_013389236.1 39S ribosomal protein L37, mitochondrial [Lingula anatina]|eukprot:XP_013389235.1 39S ribosomal protein L37, mitochondrial [Lingula anatina]